MSEERTDVQEQAQATAETTFDVTEEAVREVIRDHVYDPEIGINIVDLGLVYDIKVLPEERRVIITMTLTAPGCPVGPQILASTEGWVREKFPQVEDVEINLVWSPPWNPSMMSDEAKDMLGIY